MGNRSQILILVIIAGQICACVASYPARRTAGSAPRGDLATMRQASSNSLVSFPDDQETLERGSWLEIDLYDKPDHTVTKLWAREDETACRREWTPRNHVGYVLFRTGTTQPVAYAGELGSCAKEPPLPEYYRDHDRFRCNFSEDATVEVHSYAWPAEIGDDTTGNDLSRRRAEIVGSRIRSTAIPNQVSGVHIHGTDFSQVPTSQGERVIGVAFVVRSHEGGDSVRAPRFNVGTGPAISDKTKEQLGRYITGSWLSVDPDDTGDYTNPGKSAKKEVDGLSTDVYPPWLRIQRFWSVYKEPIPRDEFRSHPFVEWTESVVEQGCDPTGIEPPELQEYSE